MAQYQHLEIYRTAYEFLVYFSRAITHFTREYRYTIGEKLLCKIMDFIVLIYKVNSQNTILDKLRYIEIMENEIQYIKVSLRLCCDVRSLAIDKYTNCNNYCESIEKQLSSWKKYLSDRKNIKETENGK